MKNNDEAAFPHYGEDDSVLTPQLDLHPGLTKREYFAGQALFAHLWLNRNVREPDAQLAQNIAMDAVACADALLIELAKEKQG